MVERIAGKGQAVSLHRVGKNYRWCVVDGIRLSQDVEQTGQIVSTEIADDAPQLVVGNVGNRSSDSLSVGAVGDVAHATAKLGSVLNANENLVFLIAHFVNAIAQRGAVRTGHCSGETGPVFRFEHAPPGAGKERLQAPSTDAGDNTVE